MKIPTILALIICIIGYSTPLFAATGKPGPKANYSQIAVVFLIGADTTVPAKTATPTATDPVAGTVTTLVKEVPKAKSHPKPIPIITGPLIKTTPAIVPKIIKPIIRIH